MPKQPEQVFTPRAFEVNPAMYVDRPDLEAALTSALRSNKQVIVHGESGSGKSWLYKKTLTDLNCVYQIADCANASRLGSLTKEFGTITARRKPVTKTGYDETKKAGIGVPGFGSGELSHVGKFSIASEDPYEACLSTLRAEAGDRMAAIVIDNFERIVDNTSLIKEVADIITLTDNPNYAKYKVKLIIVGVPSDLRSYFSEVDQQNTIANRLTEIPEVSRLNVDQVRQFVKQGFVSELQYDFDDPTVDEIARHVAWATDRIPQHLHEYCYELALIGAIHNGVISPNDLLLADSAWLKSSLASSYTTIEGHMNSKSTAAGRRNQTIYALGQCTSHDFRYGEIEEIIRSQFPNSTQDLSLNVSQLLSGLSEGDSPLITQTPKGDAYRFVSPKYRMCIRVMLRKDTSGNRVEKIELGSLY